MTNIFDNVSNSRREIYKIEEWGKKDEFLLVNNKGKGQSSAKSYILDNFDNEAQTYFDNWRDLGIIHPYNLENNSRGYPDCKWNNDLIFKILDNNSNVLWSKAMQTCRDREKGLEHTTMYIPLLSLYAQTFPPHPRLIFAKRNYFLFVELSPDVLEKAKSVEMSYVQN